MIAWPPLKQVPILSVLSGERLGELARICKWQDYEASEQILNYHDPSTEVFFLAAGKVRSDHIFGRRQGGAFH
jgi:signal-transduction protein with cAMP-binding, CBS, and nucleotidyltransferase domain